MECSHWPTPTQTPIKNGFNYNMQHCSDWPTPTQTLIPTQMQMGCKPILSVSMLVSVSASVNTPSILVLGR